MAETIEKKQSPAYATYATFANFIKGLDGIVPNQIDKSVMGTMSGSAQAAMKTTLQFLQLTDNQGNPSPKMRKLVEADEQDQKEVLNGVLTDAYPFISNGSLDLETATLQQLEDWFRSQGISGTTVDKSVKFFLDAAKAADVPLGKYLKQKSRRRSTTPRKKATRRKVSQKKTGGDSSGVAAPKGTTKFDIPLPGKDVVAAMILPDDMDEDDWDMLKQMFELYAQRLIKANAIDNNGDEEGGDENEEG